MRIAIVGAGIMGRMLAWQLVQAGYRPTIYDKDRIDGGSAAAYTAAGMLAPWAELETGDELVFRMGMASLALWAQLASELGPAIGYQANGTLVVSHPQERSELQRFVRLLRAHSSMPDTGACTLLDHAGLAKCEPELADTFREALLLPGEAWLNNRQVMARLGACLRKKGVHWHQQTPVASLAPGAIKIAGTRHVHDVVIDCRGLAARHDIAGLRGVRGELIRVHAPAIKLRHMVRLLHPRYRLYLAPGKDDTCLLGATQLESESTDPLTVRSALELLSALYSLHRGFGEAHIIDSRVNCRPALPDNLPVIDTRPGLIRINGLYRHGFLLAPVLAQELVRFLEQPDGNTLYFPEVFTNGENRGKFERTVSTEDVSAR